MNKKLFYGAFAFAALGLASCSSDEPVNGGGSNSEWNGDKYVYVRLNDVNNTRATDGENEPYEKGQGVENQLDKKHVRFYFFNANGNPFVLSQIGVNGVVQKTNMVIPEDLSNATTDGNGTNATTCALILGKPDEAYVGTTPTQMVCVTGLSDAEFEGLAQKNLVDFQTITTKLSLDGVYSSTGMDEDGLPISTVDTRGFVMSNSTYVDENAPNKLANNVVFATDITDNVKTTLAAAEAAPADIYIERLAAKVRVSEGLQAWTAQESVDGTLKDLEIPLYKEGATNADGMVIDYVKANVKVVLNGWNTVNQQTECRIVKNLGSSFTAFPYNNWDMTKWNNAAYHRSFWAATPTDAYQINHSDKIAFDRLTIGQFDKAEPLNNIKYIYPNTIEQPEADTNWGKSAVSDRGTDATAVAILATVYVKEPGAADFETTPTQLVNFGGMYYRYEDFEATVKQAYLNTSYCPTGVTAADLTFSIVETEGTNYRTGKLDYTAAYKAAHDGASIGTQFNSRWIDILFWKGGQTSYYMNIKHDNLTDGTALYGIVRNHIYDITLTGVVGLGVPGEEIEEPKNETQSYLAARINVLNWKLVTNNVILGQ